MRSPMLPVVCALVLAPSLVGCARPLTGGWSGDVDCANGDGDVAAQLEQSDAEDIDGDVWFQVDSFFGRATFRTQVGDVDLDDDGSYELDLHFEPEDDDDRRVDFRLSVAYGDSDSVLEGEVDVLDDEGTKTEDCSVDLVRVGEEAP
jgi:hypothetical protein